MRRNIQRLGSLGIATKKSLCKECDEWIIPGLHEYCGVGPGTMAKTYAHNNCDDVIFVVRDRVGWDPQICKDFCGRKIAPVSAIIERTTGLRAYLCQSCSDEVLEGGWAREVATVIKRLSACTFESR